MEKWRNGKMEKWKNGKMQKCKNARGCETKDECGFIFELSLTYQQRKVINVSLNDLLLHFDAFCFLYIQNFVFIAVYGDYIEFLKTLISLMDWYLLSSNVNLVLLIQTIHVLHSIDAELKTK
jgi:hypothetical protein